MPILADYVSMTSGTDREAAKQQRILMATLSSFIPFQNALKSFTLGTVSVGKLGVKLE